MKTIVLTIDTLNSIIALKSLTHIVAGAKIGTKVEMVDWAEIINVSVEDDQATSETCIALKDLVESFGGVITGMSIQNA